MNGFKTESPVRTKITGHWFGSEVVDLTSPCQVKRENNNNAAAMKEEPKPDEPFVDVNVTINRASLNEEQREAANMAIYGKGNMFLTGAAGTGKSYLLRFIIQTLKSRRKGNVFVTATTGIAAENIKGTTLHSFAGIGLGGGTVDQLVEKIKSSKPAQERWAKVKILIVDEVSMLHKELFEKLEKIAQIMKTKKPDEKVKPFGGIKLILCGDFFQLPPVDRSRDGAKYAFQSKVWTDLCAIRTVALREVHRQSDDIFVCMLNEIRIGKLSEHSRRLLDECHVTVKPLPTDGILPTKLYCLNCDVDRENLDYLNKLPGPDFTYSGRDHWTKIGQEEGGNGWEGEYNRNGRLSITAELDRKAPLAIRLRVGAQVMYTRNEPTLGLVNGSRGVVVSLTDAEPSVLFDNGETILVKKASIGQRCDDSKLTRFYWPLKLAWALTVHKSQGMTLTRVELQLHNAFECGQVYVALSRVKSLPGLFIRGGRITPDLVRADEAVLAMFGQIVPMSPAQYRGHASVKNEVAPIPQWARGINHLHSTDVPSAWTDEMYTGVDDSTVPKRKRSALLDPSLSDFDYNPNESSSSEASYEGLGRSRHSAQNRERESTSSSASGYSSAGGPFSVTPCAKAAAATTASVIDLVSPRVDDRTPAAARPEPVQDAFQRLVDSNLHMYVLPNDDSVDVYGDSQPSQDGPFSFTGATYSQLQRAAYESAALPFTVSSSSSSSSTSSSSEACNRKTEFPRRFEPRLSAAVPIRSSQPIMQAQSSPLLIPTEAAASIPIPAPALLPVSPPLPVSAVVAAPCQSGASAATASKSYMYFDGGALGNPGVGGAGYLLYPDSAKPPHVTPSIPFAEAAVRMNGICTNNQAEYVGLIHGLQAAQERGVRVLAVYGDSELVLKQMKGEYKVKNPVLKTMHEKAQGIARKFSAITYTWVPRNSNKPADALSNRAMYQAQSAQECADWLVK